SRAISRVAGVAVVPAVGRPLPHVAVDLVETPGGCCETVHRHRPPPVLAYRAAPIDTGAIIIRLLGCDRWAPPERGGGVDLCHVLALGLGRWALGLAGFMRKPSGRGRRVAPFDVDRGALAAAPAQIVGSVAATSAVGDTGDPLIERHG